MTGYVADVPIGGVAWDYLQYAIGLSALGHEVYYFEDTGIWPYDPARAERTEQPDYSVRFLEQFFSTYAPSLADSWRYVHINSRAFGIDKRRWQEIVRNTDIFLNVSGSARLPDGLPSHCRRVFLDTDPGYNQLVMSTRPSWSPGLDQWLQDIRDHDVHFTYAEHVNCPDTRMPLAGIDWKTTRMPVDMESWRSAPPSSPKRPWTTVLSWERFAGPLEYEGVRFEGKAPEFAGVAHLPSLVDQTLRLAVGGQAPRQQLEDLGWLVSDGPSVTLTPADYRDFIRASAGEISIAKDTYVKLRTGWFSTRSACYLAAARPVVTQDTGFSHHVPTGRGLHAFEDVEEAAVAIEAVTKDLDRESRWAVDVARAYFSSDVVLPRLISEIAE